MSTLRWQFLSSFCFCECYLISLIVILTKLEATREIDGCFHFATTIEMGQEVYLVDQENPCSEPET